MNLFESPTNERRLERKHRKLQNGNNPDDVVLQGYFDSDGVAAIVEGGVARFITQNGMQACDITKVTRVGATLFLLETTCGYGTLELLNLSDAGSRRLGEGDNFEVCFDNSCETVSKTLCL